MSDAAGIPPAVGEQKRRAALADFFTRLWKEKPLGTACGIVVLILILVGIFGDVLTPYPYTEQHMADRSGIFLTIVVYGFKMSGDAVRDLLDPRLRGGTGRFSGPRRPSRRKRPD